MRVVKGRVVGNTVVLDEPLPEGTEVGVVIGDDAEATNWNLSDREWLLLREAQESFHRGESVTDEELTEVAGDASAPSLDEETVQEVLAAVKEADAGGEFVTSEQLWASIRERPRK